MAQQLSARTRKAVSGALARRTPSSSWSGFVGPITTLIILVVWTFCAGMSQPDGFRSPFSHYEFAMGWTGVPVAFPFLVLIPFILPFSQQLTHRWVFYTRTRMSPGRYLCEKVVTNAWMNFGVFFVYCFVSFVFFYYAAPYLGVTYDPDGYVGATDLTEARLTSLIGIHPLIYALAYSAWQGANAVLWASVGLIAVLLIRQRILAFTIPFALFALLSILMGVAGVPFAWNTPWLMWILFSVSDVPFLPSVLTLGTMYAIVAVILWLTIRRANRLGVLQ